MEDWKWREEDVDRWSKEQIIKRSYDEEVVSKIKELGERFHVQQYGALSQDPERYPLYALTSPNFSPDKKTVLITGGVHGYETSGVQGALGFMERAAAQFEDKFNIVCVPCISPWAYETVNRWNSRAFDPNRWFTEESPVEECRLFLDAMKEVQPFAHFDLHETTDTDNTIFRPAKADRDGVAEEWSEIPDGFYAVGDSENPQADFQRAIIESVNEVTHIAQPDEHGHLIGTALEQEGVVNYPVKKLKLCAGFSNAAYTTTTEVYPDSPRVSPEVCIDAQIAAVVGGLKYLLSQEEVG
ncbi:M14 family metallocarboxypeptidase [Patescibacteria group bacterium]|nr:M14 family metallocarboxypeptidase [Patescibacteria group bacterium]